MPQYIIIFTHKLLSKKVSKVSRPRTQKGDFAVYLREVQEEYLKM